MSITIAWPFKIYGQDKEGQAKICAHMNQVALAEIEKDPHSMTVIVTPIAENPIPIGILANVAPLAVAFASSYVVGLNEMVKREIQDAATAAAQKSGNGKRSIMAKHP